MSADTKTSNPPSTDALDAQSLAAIRDILSEDTAPAKPPRREKAQTPRAVPEDAAPPVTSPPHTQLDTPATSAQRPAPTEKQRVQTAADRIAGRLKASIKGYRPTPRHIIVAGAVLLVVFRPWLVLGLVFLFLFVFAGILLILGYDGFWRQVMRLGRWYARKHPSRSGELHRKLDRFAMRFDAFLDRFPEGTVDGLYLPDLGDLTEADKRHDAALDRRFDTLRES
ncbi:MAG: hypothetical protein AAF744_06475 [Pseudomonadota bacterium]